MTLTIFPVLKKKNIFLYTVLFVLFFFWEKKKKSQLYILSH